MTRLLPLLLLVLLGACDQAREPGERPKASKFENYTEKGDLSTLRERGYLRLIAPTFDIDSRLPRQGVPMEAFREEAEAFARSEKLTPVWVYVDTFAELLDTLRQGKGDLVVTNLTQTRSREQLVDFSLPVAMVNEVLVVPAGRDLPPLDEVESLTISAPRGTSYLETAYEVSEPRPAITVEPMEGGLGDREMVRGVAKGRFEAVIIDSNMARILVDGNQKVRQGAVVKKNRAIGWAARPDNPELRRRLNEYLISHRVLASRDRTEKRDWKEIVESGELRVITSNNPASYFVWRGDLMGFDYELMRRFAEKHDLQVSMVVRNTPSDMFKALKAGKGDLVAASLTNTERRRKQEINFSRRYLEVHEKLVQQEKDEPIESLNELGGRTVAVNPESSYFDTLQSLQKLGVKVDIKEKPEASTEDLIEGVDEGRHPLTVADSHLAALEDSWRDGIQVTLKLSDKRDIAWALRPDQPQLMKQLNSFIGQEYRSTFYNLTYRKYFKEPKTMRSHQEYRVKPGQDISPFDHLVKKYAREHGYDWRMITSQMFQESRFNPKATSFAGARGLMQVMPRTGREFGFNNLTEPETSIAAGVTYLDWLWDRFPGDMPLEERIYFTLAAYNAGHGHVRDARRLARQQGLDPDRWFDNVEKAMLLLAEPEYYRNARYGYVRGTEPVNYVREIRDRYIAYLEVTEDEDFGQQAAGEEAVQSEDVSDET
jgi:membrane-bound lytic murein transglycosylase F